MSWFEDIWELNYEFFDKPELAAATPYSQLDKLAEELEELRGDHSIEEAADVMVCLIGFLIKSSMEPWEFLQALEDKTTKNLARTWKHQANGTYQHITEG